jgi:hypothetical protein
MHLPRQANAFINNVVCGGLRDLYNNKLAMLGVY